MMFAGRATCPTCLTPANRRKRCGIRSLQDRVQIPKRTQLAQRGARLHTIMSVLGHTSVSITPVYAQIGDPEVLADYQAVLGPDVTTAGPSASALRNHDLPPDAVHWLKANFFRTEL